MVRPLDDLSKPVLVSAIRANQLEFFRYLGRSPQAELNDGPPVAWLLTGIAHPFMNNVLGTQLTADDVDDGIANVLSYFASRKVPHFSWWIDLDCRPADLAEHLSDHGLLYTDGGPGMAADLCALNESVPIPGDLSILPVTNTETLRQWVAAFCAGFDLLESRDITFNLFVGLGFDLPLRSFVGTVEGEPAATAQLFLGAGVAGVYCVSTVPEARRRGIGAALTLAALRKARRMGYYAAVLTSSPMGLGVYQRLGFEELCRMSHFYLSAGSV
jgi:ribosomal protein S18 acetylase RimI-like enzyme